MLCLQSQGTHKQPGRLFGADVGPEASALAPLDRNSRDARALLGRRSGVAWGQASLTPHLGAVSRAFLGAARAQNPRVVLGCGRARSSSTARRSNRGWYRRTWATPCMWSAALPSLCGGRARTCSGGRLGFVIWLLVSLSPRSGGPASGSPEVVRGLPFRWARKVAPLRCSTCCYVLCILVGCSTCRPIAIQFCGSRVPAPFPRAQRPLPRSRLTFDVAHSSGGLVAPKNRIRKKMVDAAISRDIIVDFFELTRIAERRTCILQGRYCAEDRHKAHFGSDSLVWACIGVNETSYRPEPRTSNSKEGSEDCSELRLQVQSP